MKKDKVRSEIFIYIMRLTIIFIIMVFSMLGARVITNMISSDKIKENIRKSAIQLNKEGVYPHFGWKFDEWDASVQIDLYTDRILINNNYSIDNDTPFRDALLNPLVSMPTRDFEMFLNPEKKTLVNEFKPQYWWGVQSISRLFLRFMRYSTMIDLLQLVFVILFFTLGVVIYKQFGKYVTGAFIISMWSVNFNMASFLTCTIFVFIITFISGTLVIKNYEKYRSIRNIYIIIFITAALTGYLDWMSTTILSFAFPSILALLIINKYEYQRNIQNFKITFFLGIHWVLGYLLTIASKWILVAALTEYNIFEVAMGRITGNISNKVDWAPDNYVMYILAALRENIFNLRPLKIGLNNMQMIYFSVVIVSITVILWFINKSKRGMLTYVILIAVVPLCWFVVIKSHSFIHHWFTYRSLAAFVFAWFLLWKEPVEKVWLYIQRGHRSVKERYKNVSN